MQNQQQITKAPLYHLVMGGRVKDPVGLDFEDLTAIDIVGIYPDFKSAEKAWRAAAQRTVDDAQMKYMVVHIHRLLEQLVQPCDEDE